MFCHAGLRGRLARADLSWIAKERNSLQDQVQKLYDIPALISRLKDN
ncbi:MAG: hypothetical protein PHD82_16740 [Candidatus Riflebacteria bacterium]|jgi:hypothetical protein|nr:hypothetical protein [Candidatus Riflebacteria bacterium]